MRELFNLVVALEGRELGASRPPAQGLAIETGAAVGGRTLAWIDDEFGGAWSSEAAASSNVVAYRNGAPAGFASYDAQGLRFRWLRGLAREPGVGIFGPIGVARGERGAGLGAILLNLALDELARRGYRRAVVPAVSGAELIAWYERACGAAIAERFDVAELLAPPPRTVVMASGTGTNFQAVVDAVAAGTLPLNLAGLIVNRSKAFAIERARRAGIAVRIETWDRKTRSREAYDEGLLETVRSLEPDLILLLGWMHLLPAAFVEAFGTVLNVHPAFLPLDPAADEVTMPDGTCIPAFRGPNAVEDALRARSRWVGATVHEVTAATDRGPVLIRKPLAVGERDDLTAVMQRLHPIEHAIVAGAVRRWLYER